MTRKEFSEKLLWIIIAIIVALILALFAVSAKPPKPPAGVCDEEGDIQCCIRWWNELNERQ
tara:strand:+ start:569 stop:751 length:183 start_codon:yes stop_codon:yes gene_type:complete